MFTASELDSSNALCVATAFGNVVSPISVSRVFLALCLDHIFVIGILVRLLSLTNLVALLTFESVSDFHIGKLLERHRGKVVARLEDLLLILRLQSHAIVDVLVANLNSINRLVYLHRIDIFFNNVRFTLLLVTCRLHQVGQLLVKVLNIVGSNVCH